MPKKRVRSKKGSQAPQKPAQTAPSAAPKRKTRARAAIGASQADMIHKICGLNDPFCDHSMTAKYFDMGKQRTLSYPFRQTDSYQVNASGTQSWLFLPNYWNRWWYIAGSITAGVASFSGAAVPIGLLAGVASYRITSAGLKLTVISNANTTAGMLRIRSFGMKDSTRFGSINIGTRNCAESMDIALVPGAETAVAFKRIDDSAKNLFTPDSTLVSGSASILNWQSPGWGAILVSIEGAPASSVCLDIEQYFNYELVFDDGEGLQMIASPTPSNVPRLNDAVSLVSSETKAFVKGGVQEFGRQIINRAIQATVGGLVGMVTKNPSAARSAALAIDVN